MNVPLVLTGNSFNVWPAQVKNGRSCRFTIRQTEPLDRDGGKIQAGFTYLGVIEGMRVISVLSYASEDMKPRESLDNIYPMV